MAKISRKKSVALFEGFVILMFLQALGMFLANQFDLILPGSLMGLLLLFFALVFKIIKLEQVEGAANLLLDNMMFLFIPLNVGLVTVLPQLKQEWVAILTSILASTVLVMVVTAKVVDRMEGRRKNVKLPS
jgi:holin-like protein